MTEDPNKTWQVKITRIKGGVEFLHYQEVTRATHSGFALRYALWNMTSSIIGDLKITVEEVKDD